jgi:asparagine synthase (glutamine-hydrolysing)
MEPHLPSEIMYRPKMGFAVPLASWFRNALRERVRDAVLGERLADSGYFNQPYLKHLVDSHQSGGRDYSAPLWTLLMFDAFLQREMGQAHYPVRQKVAV